MRDVYGTIYRGCRYGKVYEVIDEKGNCITHAYSAKQARKEIDNHLKDAPKPQTEEKKEL